MKTETSLSFKFSVYYQNLLVKAANFFSRQFSAVSFSFKDYFFAVLLTKGCVQDKGLSIGYQDYICQTSKTWEGVMRTFCEKALFYPV